MRLAEIKNLVKLGVAKDITLASWDAINEYRNACDVIACSSGVCGINGALLKNQETGELYAITARCSNLFVVV